MPLYRTITVSSTIKAYVWKIQETEQELIAPIILEERSLKRLAGMKSEMHRRGYLSIRHLLANIGLTDADLVYTDNGKPHLKDGRKISITHSNIFTAIIVSSGNNIGIDIEMQRDKILRIAHKFTPIEEYKTIANSEALIRKLTIVWGAKESLYKLYGEAGLSFLNHINVADFSMDEEITAGEILFKGKASQYQIAFEEFEGFTLVYAVSEN